MNLIAYQFAKIWLNFLLTNIFITVINVPRMSSSLCHNGCHVCASAARGVERRRRGESFLLTWRVPLKFRECCCIQLLLVAARLRRHGNTVLRACSRSFIPFWTERHAAHRMHSETAREKQKERGEEWKGEEGRRKKKTTSKWPIESTSVTPHSDCSDLVITRPPPPPPHPRALMMQTHQLTLSTLKKERNKQAKILNLWPRGL